MRRAMPWMFAITISNTVRERIGMFYICLGVCAFLPYVAAEWLGKLGRLCGVYSALSLGLPSMNTCMNGSE